jgi:spore coat polysaccharide biosynthesis protein SpsF
VKRVYVVQARMTSTRLPGKVLMDLAGAPMLAQQLRRLKRCKTLDGLVVATTTNASDDPLCALAEREGAGVFRGSENDVLSRYVGAARQARADVVVRVTSDCPLIVPELCDEVVAALGGHDYASNVLERSYPRGLDCEALTRQALEKADERAASEAAREHVTYFLVRERPDLFKLKSVRDSRDNSDLRWTVDTPEDLAVARAMYDGLGLGARPASYQELLDYARKHPEIAALNSQVRQKRA